MERVDKHQCRACRGTAGHLVLDLGAQPESDYFLVEHVRGPDPDLPAPNVAVLILRVGTGQVDDLTVPEEPRGVEPAALVAQAASAVQRARAAGLPTPGSRVAAHGSLHGGSWLGLLANCDCAAPRGRTDTAAADVVLDCFDLMHAADQSSALAERVRGRPLLRGHAAPVPLARYDHPRRPVERAATWALRLLPPPPRSLRCSLRSASSARTAWEFGLYGGTVLLAARRDAHDDSGSPGRHRAWSGRE